RLNTGHPIFISEKIIVIGWTRDQKRHRLTQLAAAVRAADPSVAAPTCVRPQRCCKYSEESRALLVTVWEWSGYQSGKYLAAVMPALLDAAERHGALVPGRGGYSSAVRAELLAVSPASIDRYLRTTRASD